MSCFRRVVYLLLLLLLPSNLFSQVDIGHYIGKLKYVDNMPYICKKGNHELLEGCGHKVFWELVKQKEKSIPFLLEKLNDTTITKAVVPYFGYNYSVADIAYTALREIIHNIPTFELLGVKFEQEGCGYCVYWRHLNEKYQNRLKFQIAVQNWYDSNKNNLIWVESSSFSSCDCGDRHPNNGHYELKSK